MIEYFTEQLKHAYRFTEADIQAIITTRLALADNIGQHQEILDNANKMLGLRRVIFIIINDDDLHNIIGKTKSIMEYELEQTCQQLDNEYEYVTSYNNVPILQKNMHGELPQPPGIAASCNRKLRDLRSRSSSP